MRKLQNNIEITSNRLLKLAQFFECAFWYKFFLKQGSNIETWAVHTYLQPKPQAMVKPLFHNSLRIIVLVLLR